MTLVNYNIDKNVFNYKLNLLIIIVDLLYENIGVTNKSDVIDHPSLKGTMSY